MNIDNQYIDYKLDKNNKICIKNRCLNNKIGNSNYCRLRSHHFDKISYEKARNYEIKKFNKCRINPSMFKIIDGVYDGACLYRSFWEALYDFYPIETPESYQENARKWIMTHRNDKIPQLNETYENLTLETHELDDLEEYEKLYRIPASAPNEIKVEIIQENNKTRNKYKKVVIPDRWGGLSELYALSDFYRVPVKVYVLQRFNRKTFKINNVTLKSKDTKLYLLHFINDHYLSRDRLDYCVNLLYIDTDNIQHYMCLMPK
jgi:hypothetical protein